MDLTDCPRSFQKSNVPDTRFTDFHKLTVAVPDMEYQHFLNLFTEILRKHAPLEKKYIRANLEKLITKDQDKAINNRPRLCNRFLSNKIKTSRKE